MPHSGLDSMGPLVTLVLATNGDPIVHDDDLGVQGGPGTSPRGWPAQPERGALRATAGLAEPGDVGWP